MVVVDASVICKWLIEEDPESTQKAHSILLSYLESKEEIIVPDILLYELSNIFSNKSEVNISQALKNWDQFSSYKIKIFTPDTDFFIKCIEFSKKYHVSVYDASYAVLALDKNCKFITADEKFVSTVKEDFVLSLSSYN